MGAGCINIPDEQTSIPDDAGIDAGAPDCSPETSTDLVPDVLGKSTIYTAATADLNGDGCADLVVTHVGGQPGIFVKYGPLDKTGGMLRYDEHIITTTQPVALAVANVVGDTGLDIVVFGPTSFNNNESAGRIEIFGNSLSGGNRYAGTSVTVNTFVPAFMTTAGDLPLHIAIGEFGGDINGQKIAVADLTTIEMYNAGDLSNRRFIGRDGLTDTSSLWNTINKLLPYSDGLLILELDRISYQANGASTTSPFTVPNIDEVRTAELFDLDGDSDLDLVTAGLRDIGGFRNDGLQSFPGSPINNINIADASDIYQVSVIPNSPPIVAFFEQTPNRVVYDLTYNTSNNSIVRSTARTPIALGQFLPVVAVVTDSGEYRVISDDGQSRCFVPNADTLVPCSQ